MITSFKSREIELIFQGRVSLKYPRSIQVDALRKLRIIDAATAKGSGRICTHEFDTAQSSSTSAISEASYAPASDTISDRLQGIFHQDEDDFDELDDETPSRYRRRRDVFDTALDDYIDR